MGGRPPCMESAESDFRSCIDTREIGCVLLVKKRGFVCVFVVTDFGM